MGGYICPVIHISEGLMPKLEFDYTRACFVIMPFGQKTVGGKEIDFEVIYRDVFEPAISATPLPAPETGFLQPHRTDQDTLTKLIDQEMFHYLEYSRFAFADISGLNPNVLYELGVRHRANPAGTAVFRQVGTDIPFDIKMVRAFEYSYEPMEAIKKSKELITKVLTDSLKCNQLDSPVQLALHVQRRYVEETEGKSVLEETLLQARQFLLAGKRVEAVQAYRKAVALAPANPKTRMRLGLLLKDLGKWEEALQEFRATNQLLPGYAEGLREQGIAENRLYQALLRKGPVPPGTPTGEESLRQAIALVPEDYDALSSYGGIVKRHALRLDHQGKAEESMAFYDIARGLYEKATEVSYGDAYPFLNALKIRSRIEGKLDMSDMFAVMNVEKAEQSRRAQAEMKPPMDMPWSAFDLAELLLYRGRKDEALDWLTRGVKNCTNASQPRTFRESLELLSRGGVAVDGLDQCLDKLKAAEKFLPAG